MKQRIDAFALELDKLEALSPNSISDFDFKPNATSWSKKEILGHLVDSAINNLIRFTEIQYTEKPYRIRPYNQDELVKANDYQNKDNQDLLDLLVVLNRHIVYLIQNQTEETLKSSVILPNQEMADLKFIIEDYLDHFYHHLSQIRN